jgi:hypothetical protein
VKFTWVTVAVAALLATFTPVIPVNAAPYQIEIINMSDATKGSVEITFDSSIPKNQISNYTITAVPDRSYFPVTANASWIQKNFKLKTVNNVLTKKVSGLITYRFKTITLGMPYTFRICAKKINGTSSCSDRFEYPQGARLLDQISRLPSDWGNPKSSGTPTQDTKPAVAVAAPAFTLSSSSQTVSRNSAITNVTSTSTGGAIESYSITPAAPAGLTFNQSDGSLSGTPTTSQTATNYAITATNASGSATQIFSLAVRYIVGDRGPGNGIIFYVSATNFTSAGSTCNTTCSYLEVAPSTWRTGSAALDPRARWSSNGSLVTGQNIGTTSTEGFDAAQEKLNWQIGQGFNNTNSMKVADATSEAQAAVLAFGATDSSTGQWFLPSANELNELCKYAYGLTTGDPKIRCNPSAVGATLKNSVSGDLGGFLDQPYWSSSEQSNSGAFFQTFSGGANFQGYGKINGGGAGANLYIRPIRAL